MKTGRGKTFTLVKMIEYFDKPTLVLCHNKDTVTAMYEEIKSSFSDDITVTQVMSGKKKGYGDICVTTHAGFAKNPDQYIQEKNGEGYSVIMYDECDFNLSFPG